MGGSENRRAQDRPAAITRRPYANDCQSCTPRTAQQLICECAFAVTGRRNYSIGFYLTSPDAALRNGRHGLVQRRGVAREEGPQVSHSRAKELYVGIVLNHKGPIFRAEDRNCVRKAGEDGSEQGVVVASTYAA